MGRMLTRTHVGTAVALAILALFFVGATWAAQAYQDRLIELLGNSWWGPLVYLVAKVVAVVLAPVSTLPLLPVASVLWGPVVAGTLTVIGYVLGAQIAFFLARTFGERLVGRLAPLEKVRSFERRVPRHHVFWSVVLLRMLVPVDVLSYALGLFSTMSARAYLIATLIGVTPFSFVFAYAGTLSWRVQVYVVGATLAFVILGHTFYTYRSRERRSMHGTE